MMCKKNLMRGPKFVHGRQFSTTLPENQFCAAEKIRARLHALKILAAIIHRNPLTLAKLLCFVRNIHLNGRPWKNEILLAISSIMNFFCGTPAHHVSTTVLTLQAKMTLLFNIIVQKSRNSLLDQAKIVIRASILSPLYSVVQPNEDF